MIGKIIDLLRYISRPDLGKAQGSLGAAYRQGLEALETGSHNPYADGSRLKKAWDEGLREANNRENMIW
jgi:hypothetical protein